MPPQQNPQYAAAPQVTVEPPQQHVGYASYQQQPMQPGMQIPGYQAMPIQEAKTYEAYPSIPVETAPVEDKTPGLAESMEYTFFPSEQSGESKGKKSESSGEGTSFIDYPMEPIPPPPKPVPPVDSYSFYSNVPKTESYGATPTAPTHASVETPVYPSFQTEPVAPIPAEIPVVPVYSPPVHSPSNIPSFPAYPPSQAIPVPAETPSFPAYPSNQAAPIPVEPQSFPTYPPNQATPAPVEAPSFPVYQPSQTVPTPVPVEVPDFPVYPPSQSVPIPTEPPTFTDFPSQSPPAIELEPIIEKPDFPTIPDISMPVEVPEPFASKPAIPVFPPVSPKPITGSVDVTKQIDDDFSSAPPRQIDADLLFMDDDVIMNSPFIATSRPAQPELLFMDKTDTTSFKAKQTKPNQTIHAVPRPMNHDDYQTIDMPDYNGFARNPDPDIIAHMTPKKSRLPFILIGIAIIVIAAIAFFIFTSGNVSHDDIVGTWVQPGPTMGSVVTRLQFNDDGTGREYRFNEFHQTVESETTFEWHIEGRNRLISSLWSTGATVQLSTRTGEINLRYRLDGQDYWQSWRPVRVAD